MRTAWVIALDMNWTRWPHRSFPSMLPETLLKATVKTPPQCTLPGGERGISDCSQSTEQEYVKLNFYPSSYPSWYGYGYRSAREKVIFLKMLKKAWWLRPIFQRKWDTEKSQRFFSVYCQLVLHQETDSWIIMWDKYFLSIRKRDKLEEIIGLSMCVVNSIYSLCTNCVECGWEFESYGHE